MSFFRELKRRNVIRAGLGYLAAVWLLLQVADIVVPLLGGPVWLLQALFFSALLGFPLVAVVAWFYELTPEGFKADARVEAAEAIHFTGRKIDFVIIGLLVVAVGFLLVKNFEPAEGDRSIAVLPFDNRSIGDEEAAIFAAGMHDDLITLLSKLSDVRVISRQSVERFRGTKQGIREIGKSLGASAVLEGGVRVAGDRVRINVQLTEAGEETSLWAEVYDRELTAANIFSIQSEVALNIVNNLKATLSHDERQRLAVVPTRNLQAYEAYLLGKQEMTKRTVVSMQAAIGQFQRAIDLDEDFALAYVGLAECYSVLQDWGHSPSAEVLPMIEAAVTRALELDSQLGEAYVSLAALYELGGKHAAAEAAYTRAIELNPGYETAHSWYGLFLNWRMGHIEEAVQHAEQALILNPLSAVLRMAYGDVLLAAGRFDDALSQYQKSIELEPQFGGSHKMIGDHLLYTYGRTSDALQSYRNALAVESDPDWMGDIGGIYLVLGDTAAAEEWTERARLTDPKNVMVYKHLAILNYYQGQDGIAEDYARAYLGGPFDVYIPYMLFILRNADLRAGRFADARLRYEELFPGLAEVVPVVHRSNFRAAIDLSVVVERMGEKERAQLLRQRSLVAIRNKARLGLYGYGSADADIHALEGRSSQALSALRAAVEEGWWRHWYMWTELNPNLDSIRDEPEYRAIVAELESIMATELEQLRASEARRLETVL